MIDEEIRPINVRMIWRDGVHVCLVDEWPQWIKFGPWTGITYEGSEGPYSLADIGRPRVRVIRAGDGRQFVFVGADNQSALYRVHSADNARDWLVCELECVGEPGEALRAPGFEIVASLPSAAFS